MLYRASIKDVKDGRVTRRYGYLVAVMQFYPRYLPKKNLDEFLHALAPARDLFTEFKAKDRELSDHNLAFETVKYENRFELTGEGMANLERLSSMSGERNVFLLCQCQALERCHADLLLLLARHHFHASIQKPRLNYAVFEERLQPPT